MIVGYVRTDSNDGPNTRFEQMEKLLEFGLLPENIFEDLTTTYSRQPRLRACLRCLKAGDTLIVRDLFCLARNLTNLVPTIRSLLAKGITLRILVSAGGGVPAQISAASTIMDLVSTLTAFERERVQQARASRPKPARPRGRPFRLTWDQVYEAARAVKTGRTTRSAISKDLGISGTTLLKYITARGDLTPLAHALEKTAPSARPAREPDASNENSALLESLISMGRHEFP